MFSFADSSRGRRLNLTPMIDVVFLLLVFFMLASRFGNDTSLPLGAEFGTSSSQSLPPRLIDITPTSVRVNGMTFNLQTLHKGLSPLKVTPSDVVIVRPIGKTDVQRLVTVLDVLRDEGFSQLVLTQSQ